jgi:hypothetical protein
MNFLPGPGRPPEQGYAALSSLQRRLALRKLPGLWRKSAKCSMPCWLVRGGSHRIRNLPRRGKSAGFPTLPGRTWVRDRASAAPPSWVGQTAYPLPRRVVEHAGARRSSHAAASALARWAMVAGGSCDSPRSFGRSRMAGSVALDSAYRSVCDRCGSPLWSGKIRTGGARWSRGFRRSSSGSLP